jgi:hypothetical protein
MTAPLSYLTAHEHVSDLARVAGEQPISRTLAYCRARRLSRISGQLRLRVAKQTTSDEPARLAPLVDSPGRLA